MSTNKTIAKNTMILYTQLLLGMLIGLYTSRVILNVLGIEDFGIYNVVGGVVAMFGILNNAMSSSTSRFLTFELGNKNTDKLKIVFGSSLLIHLSIGLIIVMVAEPVGIWFMKTKMNIPLDRFDAALWVFHGAVACIFLSVISVPYGAVIIAHEKMAALATISIIDIILRLAIVIALPFFPFDKLIVYSLLLVVSQIIIQFMYWGYCINNFSEVQGKIRWTKSLFKEMSSFAGWSLFGDSAVLMMTQGVNILLNIFFGPIVNAGRGIAVQVQSIVIRFIGNFQTAINPQVTKSYAQNDLGYMHKLIFASSKYSFCLFLLLALPVFLDTTYILTLWLKQVPDHTVNYIRILMLISLIDCMANPLIVAAKATGIIKRYQIILGGLLLLIVPISYLLLTLGYPSEIVFIVHLAIALLGQIVRIILIKPMISLSLKVYLNKVILRCLSVLIFAPILPYLLLINMDESILRLILIILTSFISAIVVLYFIGMDLTEKRVVKDQLTSILRKKQ